MRAQRQSIANAPPPDFVRGPVLQRQCACGQHTPGGQECGHCKKSGIHNLQPNFISKSPLMSPDESQSAFPVASVEQNFSRIRTQQHPVLPGKVEAVGEAHCDVDKGGMTWSADVKKLPLCMADCTKAHELSHVTFGKKECGKAVAAYKPFAEALKKAHKTESMHNLKDAQKKLDVFEQAAKAYQKWIERDCRKDEHLAYQAGIDACRTREVLKSCADLKETSEHDRILKDWEKFRDNPPNCAAPAPAKPVAPLGHAKPHGKKDSKDKEPEKKSETPQKTQHPESRHMVQPRLTLMGALQRKCACGQHTQGGAECDECKKNSEISLQRRSVGAPAPDTAPPIVGEVLGTSGQPLDAATRAFFEPRFGYDFSGVRVHSDVRAAESARAVDALAYTVGRDVVFGLGQFEPRSMSGRRLIAHELAHVVQQSVSNGFSAAQSSHFGISRATPDALRINAVDDPSEHEADRIADAVIRPMMSMERPATVLPLLKASPHVYRKPQGDAPTKAEEKADQKLDELARYPNDAIPAWKRLNGKAQILVLFKMMGKYGEEFATEFLKYAEGKKKPSLFTTFTNLAQDNPKSLHSRGYRLAGNRGGSPLWVHPSGHQYILIHGTKAPPVGPKGDDDDSQKQQDLRKRCIDPCLLETDDEDACEKCCEKIPESDDRCRRACEASCATKL
jgi:hypothetical protein